MTTAVRPRELPPTTTPRRVRRVVTYPTLAAVTGCGALAFIVGLAGSGPWRVGRVLLVVALGAGSVLARHATAQRRAAFSLAVALPTLVAGFGIGVPHAAAGRTSVAVAGVLALASGLVLLTSAVAALWRGTGRVRRVGLVVALLAVGQWVLFPVTVAVFATNRAPMPLPARTPAEVGLEYRDVTLTTADGVPLAAWYVPSRNGAAVVLLHGSGSTRVNVLDHAAVLADEGYGVLLVDARGHGGSGGHEMDFGWHGDADIAPALAFLEATADVEDGRIGVVGMSMGGEEALGAAATLPPIRAVVVEGATGRTGSDWLPLQPEGMGRAFSALFYAVQDASAAVLSGARRPTDLRSAVIAAAPRPVLVIAAGDVAEEVTAGRRWRDAAPARVTLWEVPETGHTGALRTSPQQWRRRVGTFLDTALLGKSLAGR